MYKSLYRAYAVYYLCFEVILIGVAYYGEQYTFSDYLLRNWLLVAVFLTMPVNENFKGLFRQLVLGIVPFIAAMIGHSWFRMVILGNGTTKSSDIQIFPLILAMACCALICYLSSAVARKIEPNFKIFRN